MVPETKERKRKRQHKVGDSPTPKFAKITPEEEEQAPDAENRKVDQDYDNFERRFILYTLAAKSGT